MKKKQIANPHLLLNNNNIKKALATDYNELIDRTQYDKSFWKETKQLLLSPTRFLQIFSRVKMAKIPNNILEIAKVEGSEVMKSLEYIFNKKITNLDTVNFLSEKIKDMTMSIIQAFIDRKWKIKAMEKTISNGYWYGNVDCIVRDEHCNLALVEIKTRSSDEVRKTDIFQLMCYARMIGANNLYLVVCNKKTMKTTIHRVVINKNKKMLSVVNTYLKYFELEEYVL